MLNIDELEAKWKRYNRKRMMPYFIILFISLMIILGIVFGKYISLDSINLKDKVYSLVSKHKGEISDKEVYVKNLYIKNGFFDTLETDSKPIQQSKDNLNPIDEQDVYQDSIVKPVIGSEKRVLNISTVDSSVAYKDVIKRFNRNHNINDALFLANMFYKQKKYKQAIKWAMKTNKLDSDIEESWLIFAKSKLRLGKRNEAIRVLRAYIKRSNSYEAKKLLKKLTRH